MADERFAAFASPDLTPARFGRSRVTFFPFRSRAVWLRPDGSGLPAIDAQHPFSRAVRRRHLRFRLRLGVLAPRPPFRTEAIGRTGHYGQIRNTTGPVASIRSTIGRLS